MLHTWDAQNQTGGWIWPTGRSLLTTGLAKQRVRVYYLRNDSAVPANK